MTELRPPDLSVDIGIGHRIQYAGYKGEPAGVNVWHLKADNTWCCGWVAFHDSAWGREFAGVPDWQGWNVIQNEPLTLTPSIACRVCGDHGHITEGRWVPA